MNNKFKMFAGLLGLSVLLTGCSGQDKIPQVCEDYFAKVQAMADETPKLADQFKFDQRIKETREKWESFSDEEKEFAKKSCEQGLENLKQFEQAK